MLPAELVSFFFGVIFYFFFLVMAAFFQSEIKKETPPHVYAIC